MHLGATMKTVPGNWNGFSFFARREELGLSPQ